MIPTPYAAVILLAFLSGLTTLIGLALAIYFEKSVSWIAIGIGFSTGIMILISFFELIPESVNAVGIPNTSIALLLGVLMIAFLNFVIPHTHFVKEKGKIDARLIKAAYLIAFGLVLHDFPEGFAMANSYIYSPALGLLVALAIAIHNIPEEFAMAIPLVAIKKKSSLFKIALLSGLAEPAGAIIGLFAVSFMPALNPLFMAFAAGAMIFVSIHELLPMAQMYRRIGLFSLGFFLAAFVYIALAILIPT